VNVAELRAKLATMGVHPGLYALPGDQLPYEGFVLRQNSDARWEIVYCSRGIFNPVPGVPAGGTTEERATEHLHDLLSAQLRRIEKLPGR